MTRAMTLTAGGWVDDARRSPSPNFDARPDGVTIRLVVIHAISLPPGEFGGDEVEDFFLNRLDAGRHPYFAEIAVLRVSSHFFIRRDGTLVQFVSCADRAWHAGVSTWRGHHRCNDFSIGIELEGCDDKPFTQTQYESLRSLLSLLRRSFPIDDVVGHSDVAPNRKTDPGPCFDWAAINDSVARG